MNAVPKTLAPDWGFAKSTIQLQERPAEIWETNVAAKIRATVRESAKLTI